MTSNKSILGCAGVFFLALASSSQAAVSFVFTYQDATWSAAAKASLQNAAGLLGNYLTSYTATIPMSVTGSNANTSTLASAGASYYGNTSGLGNRGAVAELILSNGSYTLPGTFAGTVDANFFHAWGYTDTIAVNQLDFTSTMIHELGHALGFVSLIAQNGGSSFGDKKFAPFDQYVTNGSGTTVVNLSLATGTDGTWTTASIGGTGTSPATANTGLYFNGPNAVAANGGNLIPLYSTPTWSEGSSGSHLDDNFYTDANKKLMNAADSVGLGLRTFSPLEIGIFKDIGYTAFGVPEPGSTVLLGLGVFAMLRRRRAMVC